LEKKKVPASNPGVTPKVQTVRGEFGELAKIDARKRHLRESSWDEMRDLGGAERISAEKRDLHRGDPIRGEKKGK